MPMAYLAATAGADTQTSTSLQLVNYSLSAAAPGWYNAIYLQPKGGRLRSGDRMSDNNGRTWQSKPMMPDFVTGLPHGYRREPVTSVVDGFTGRLLTIVNALDTPGLDPKINEPPVAQQTYYLRYRVSEGGGRSWLFDEPVVQVGGFTAQHPFEGVWIGKNAIYLGDLGCIPIVTRTGKVLLPVQTTPLGPDGQLWNPNGGHSYTDVLVLRGTWTNGARLAWRATQRLVGNPNRTPRGLIEPTLAEFSDGRILMVMRGSNGGQADPHYKLPSYKWFAFSSDGGETWSAPEPWGFEDGSTFFSPSSMSALFRHSSGRCFWVGNLAESNCQGNLPRWPLVVGEVDSRTLKLKRSSLLAVDAPTSADQSRGRLDLSHCTLIEDRKTKQIVLTYPRSYNAYQSNEWATVRLAVRPAKPRLLPSPKSR